LKTNDLLANNFSIDNHPKINAWKNWHAGVEN
jgi:hypothetical protein